MTENTETQSEPNTAIPTIRPRAGLMRGARLWQDPDGILLSPFMENGQQMGYVYVYGEEEPAVFDGVTWHSILSGDRPWGEMQDVVMAQYYLILEKAESNEVYKELSGYVTGSAASSV
jgi:hypothetical protein